LTKSLGTWAFYLDKKSDTTLQQLSELDIFATNIDIVIFAAAIGDYYDCFIETKSNGSGFRWEGPAKDNLTSAWYLAFNKTKDPDVLLDDNKCYEILAGYANGGFEKIEEWSSDAETIQGFIMKIMSEMESIQLSH